MLIENSAEEELFSGGLAGLEIPTSLESVAGIAGVAGVREESRTERPSPGSLRQAGESVPLVHVTGTATANQPSLTRRIVAFVFEAIVGLAEGGRMVRRIGPGMRPEERHEFENPRYTEWRL